MTITQTVDIPDDRRLIIDVPREVPTGRAVLTFTPTTAKKNAEQSPIMTESEEIEYINRNAEWLNKQAEDTLEFQSLDAFEEDLERFTPKEFGVMRSTVVSFSLADIVNNRDDERLNRVSEEGSSP